ncbi:MAG: type IX secretion system sortase PorU [Flavobacteriales bacterium]
MILNAVCWMILLGLCLPSVQAQVETAEGSWRVEWMERASLDIAVGQWGPIDGFWHDEVPWNVWEWSAPENWSNAELLVDHETWEVIPAMSLTERQRQLLKSQTQQGSWSWLSQGVFQHIAPLLRYVPERDVYERFIQVDWVVGQQLEMLQRQSRARDWPVSSPLAEGAFYRLSISENGVYKIDRNWMLDAGLNPDTIDPRQIRIYGNGGAMLPMDNDVERPLGLRAAAIQFEGENDGAWGGDDAVYFWGQGPHSWKTHPDPSAWSHDRNTYSDSAWYFLQIDAIPGDSTARIQQSISIPLPADTLVDAYWNRAFHELELESPNRSGREWFGESFGSATSRLFSFPMPYALMGDAQVDFRVAAQSQGSSSSFAIQIGDSTSVISPSYTNSLSTSNVANLAGGSMVVQGVVGQGASARVDVLVDFNQAVEDAIGWLDFIRVSQPCALRMAQAQLVFDVDAFEENTVAAMTVEDAVGLSWIWDISDPCQPKQMPFEWNLASDAVTWKASSDQSNRFVLFKDYNFLTPAFHGAVGQVDLHAVQQADLVIVTRPAYLEASERLAQLHADEGLSVLVTTQRAVFDEFSSGNPDPSAIKMLMMMLRDRALIEGLDPPKYLQIMGDGTFANRSHLMQSPFVITYQSENSVSPTSSYVSDDFFGFLENEYGEGIGDKMAIGIGRIPCSSATEAEAMVDKVEAYLKSASPEILSFGCNEGDGESNGIWQNTICLVSDDMDGNSGPTEITHMVNSDEHANKISATHPEYDVSKIYLDAYPQLSTPGGERYPDAQEAIDRQVSDGALIMNYIGHGGEKGWSHERVLNTTTIQEWDNLKNMPLFMTATCELARFDDPDVDSAGEMMIMNPDGGAIAMLTTTRVVYSGSNQQLNRAFFEIALEDTLSSGLRLGDIARVTKNDPQVSNSSNKRNFTLLGDVALQLNYPHDHVYLESLPDTMRALDVIEIGGYIGDASGDILTNFNGIVHVKVFDKKAQITTLNNDNGPNPHTFEVYRNVLHRGIASVESGVFQFEFVVPRDIDFSFGSGRISCFAVSDSSDAHGATQEFIIGGVSEDFEVDSTPPKVQLFLNDTLFRSGGMTHSHPVLLARIQDDGGINAAGAGIGHDIKATLDGESDQSMVLNSYYTSDLNTYISGTVRYPFESLESGSHFLELVVWDVQNNKGKASLEFEVYDDFVSALGQVFAYPNPSTDQFTFSMEHNQACQDGTVTLEVFSSDGHLVYSAMSPWQEEGFRSEPMTWHAQGSASNPAVSAGVYVFRMTLQSETGGTVQYAEQIIVLRQ